jgi:hypothetical protein
VKIVRPVAAAVTVAAAEAAVVAVVAVAATAVVVAIGTNRHPSLYSFTGEGWSLPVFAFFSLSFPFRLTCIQILPFCFCPCPDRVLSP